MKSIAIAAVLSIATSLSAQTVEVNHRPATPTGFRVAAIKSPQMATPSAPTSTPQPVAPDFKIGWTDTNPATRLFTGYHVKWGTTPGGPYTTGTMDVIGKATVQKAFTGFALGTFYLIVTAYDAISESGASNELAFTVITPLAAPGGVGIIDDGLAQLSTRGKIGSGEESMIAGFILKGEKKIVTRALGPSLAAYGVQGVIADVNIELHDGNGTMIKANNGWKNGPDAAELTAMGLAPGDDKESAMVTTLAAGSYTAVITGSKPDGIGLAEIYQVD